MKLENMVEEHSEFSTQETFTLANTGILMNSLAWPYPSKPGKINPLKMILKMQRQDLPQRLPQETQMKIMI